MRVLVVNAGSSSLKLSVVDGDALMHEQRLPALDDGGLDALRAAMARLPGAIDAVGHRIVHGGADITGPTLVDDAVREVLGRLVDLAPLHQPLALAALDAVTDAMPETPAVACVDTAFHATMPRAASTYALPAEWRSRGVRRYGFHGLSHAYAARRAADVTGATTPRLRVVVCHLGAGASLCAVDAGRSVDTTMGFTPLEGLVMARRAGSIDPGALLWLLRHGLDLDELEAGLQRGSGLAGLAGTPDMREVLAGADAGEEDATLALDVYLHRLRAGVGAMAAAMDGLDVLVFTGGVGEGSPAVRSGACAGLDHLGVELDERLNAAAAGDADVGAAGAPVRTLIVAAREDLEISRQVRTALGAARAPRPGRSGMRAAQGAGPRRPHPEVSPTSRSRGEKG